MLDRAHSKTIFSFLKQTERLDDLYAKALPLERGKEGYVIPLGAIHNDSIFREELGIRLANAAFRSGSPTLNLQAFDSYLASPNTVMFAVTNKLGVVQALLGVEKSNAESATLEICALLDSTSGRLTTLALNAVGFWARDALSVSTLTAKTPEQKEIVGLLLEAGYELNETGWRFPFKAREPFTDPILTAGPFISSYESSYGLDAVKWGWNGEWNKYITAFENKFKDFIGVENALSTSSCTGALHLALLALEVGPGDEVIVPEITWVATAAAVRYVGATPVFVDVEADTWCLDPESFKAAITPRTKVVMPVHLYGHPANMEAICKIASENNIRIVEDAAPAIGAKVNGRNVGTYGDFAAFSFQGAKLLVTGEGGMLVSKDPALMAKAQKIWDHGRVPGTFWIDQVGWKYKMSNVQAAIGLGQLETAEAQIAAKRRIFSWYDEELRDLPGIKLFREANWAKSIYWMSSITVSEESGLTREALCAELKKQKIDTRPVFPAISQYPMWNTAQNPVAKAIGDCGINLPSGVLLRENQIRHVARRIRAAVLERK